MHAMKVLPTETLAAAIERKYNQYVVYQCCYAAGTESDILETEPYIQKHQHGRYHNRRYCAGTHFRADGRADGLCCDLFPDLHQNSSSSLEI